MLTILVPCYNEELVIENTVEELLNWVSKQTFYIEIVFINNNSSDKTGEILARLSTKKEIIVTNESIQGKGAAIKKGVLKSNFEKILILDADLSADVSQANNIDFLEDNFVVIGSRVLGTQRNTPFSRFVLGTFFNFIIRKLFKFNYLDTQCGFKYISSSRVKHIFKNISSEGFLYDIDLIHQAKIFNLKIEEQPVDYNFNRNSSISLFKDSFTIVKDIYHLRKKYNN